MKISLPLIQPVTAGLWLLLATFAVSPAGADSSYSGLAVSLTSQSSSASAVELNPDHPQRYVVVKGDTLWDISAMFLKDPWYWPEIWQVNPQVENPHLIYPGDVLILVYIDGKPVIMREGDGAERLSPQIRASDLDSAIATISLETILAFLSKGAVIEKGEYEKLPYIVDIREQHLIAGAGMDVYVRGKDIGPVDSGYSVIHIGDKLVDPDDGETVGYEGLFVGEGYISRGGDPSTLHLVKTQREALQGDRLLNQEFDIPLQFLPRSPDQDIDGRIISVINGLDVIGEYQIVIINRGAKHGLEAGHVLSVWQAGPKVADRIAGGKVQLPDEMAGHMMIFKTYDRISYGLLMEATTGIRVLDKVKTPN